MMPLKNSASIFLKTMTFKYLWQQDLNEEKDKDIILVSMAQKLYQILNSPELLSNTSREMIS